MRSAGKEKLKARRDALRQKLAAKKAAIKGKAKRMKKLFESACESGVLHLLVMAAVLTAAYLLSGCAMERADPDARSNRATYTISVVAREGSSATAYIQDGLMATADGEGAITQPSTLTTEQSPDITVPGDALTAGIQTVGSLAGRAIDAHAARSQAAAGCDGCSEAATEAK